MSQELETSVREMLKEETWTRAGISNFTKNNLTEIEKILDAAKSQNCEREIKDICDEQLNHTKDSIVALYLSGMITLRMGSVDNSALVTLTDIFEKNHKEVLIEYLCNTILEQDSTNKFALRKLADYYKNSNDDRVWEVYEKIVKLDLEEADIAKLIAERNESQGNTETAISYYKKALLRYVAQKNYNATKEMWSKLVSMIPDEIDYFLLVQRKIAKSISEEKSALLMDEVYNYYKETAKWDTAIMILKLILNIDNKDDRARKEIVECYKAKYANNKNTEKFIASSNLNQSFRNVFEAINDFEKHIAFDTKNFVFHRTWGVGRIEKVEGDMLTINFGKKNGVHTMSLKMAVSALQALPKTHIWVLKATKRKEDLVKMVKEDVAGTLKTIIKSFDNNCDEKRIKAELVPSILTTGEWTSWHAKAQKVLDSDPTFAVNPTNINLYTVRDKEMTREERLANEFKAEKQFFSRIDIMMRYLNEIDDPSDEQFAEMYSYFAGYLKSFSNVNEQIVASYLVVQEICKRVPSFENPAKFTFEQLYGDIENPKEMYTLLKDSKNTNLKEAYLKNVRLMSKWVEQYINLFPTVLDVALLKELISNGHEDKVTSLVSTCFTEYRNYRNAVIYLFDNCREESWYKACNLSREKELVTMVNIIATCYKEVNNHVNTVENKKTIKNATTILFAYKVNGEVQNTMLNYMLENDKDTITRMYTMVNDVRSLESIYKAQLRNGILSVYPDFKFQEAEVKTEAPKGLIVTAKMLEVKRALAEQIEKVDLPKIAEEVSEAREKGDLKENAEYQAGREAQRIANEKLTKLKEELARAVVFDPTTVTTSLVSFGTTVTLVNNLENKEEKLTILGPWESNADEGIISYLSPLGGQLLDLKVGENAKFEINEHKYDYTVKAIKAAKM